MNNIKSELKTKSRDLLTWLNGSLPVPGRIRLMLGVKKSIIIVFSDSTSTSLEDAVNGRTPQDVERIMGTLNPGILSLERNSRSPIEIVFMILAIISKMCEKYFHDPAALLRILEAISGLETNLENDTIEN